MDNILVYPRKQKEKSLRKPRKWKNAKSIRLYFERKKQSIPFVFRKKTKTENRKERRKHLQKT